MVASTHPLLAMFCCSPCSVARHVLLLPISRSSLNPLDPTARDGSCQHRRRLTRRPTSQTTLSRIVLGAPPVSRALAGRAASTYTAKRAVVVASSATSVANLDTRHRNARATLAQRSYAIIAALPATGRHSVRSCAALAVRGRLIRCYVSSVANTATTQTS